jgi:hypothetical protein
VCGATVTSDIAVVVTFCSRHRHICYILLSLRYDVLTHSIVLCLCAGIVVQGETEAELPEHVLACAALKYIDVEKHSPLESFPF